MGSMADSTILLIDRGDLPSLTAISMVPDPTQLILWHPLEPDKAATSRRTVCEGHTDALGVMRLIVNDPGNSGIAEMSPPAMLFHAQMLVQAAMLACQINCSKIIWPQQIGPDFQRMGEAVDLAHMVMGLASGGHQAGFEPGEFIIDLPLIDLTDEQVVDLADVSGGLMELFWPCEESRDMPCGTCHECLRWEKAFQAVNVDWPWVEVGT